MLEWVKYLVRPKPSPLKLTELAKQILTSDESRGSEHQIWVIKTVRSYWTDHGISEFMETLDSIERRTVCSGDPLGLIREEIMDAVDSSCLNSALLALPEQQLSTISAQSESFTREKLFGVYLFSELETICLRLFSLSKFLDGNKDDWFQLYVAGAVEYGKHMANMVAAGAGVYDGDKVLLAQLHEPFLQAHKDLRSNLKNSRIGAIFPPQDA